MITLANGELGVDLLDPASAAECQRQGTRYCWGGYIWRVREAGGGGDLLAGPEWPRADPTPFNGQGAPESFRHAAWPTQRPLMLDQGRGFIPGIGDVAPGPDGSPALTQPCAWEVSGGPLERVFQTRQAGLGWASELVRRVSLEGRTLSSASTITNRGKRVMPLHWFAHPFFPLVKGMLSCSLPPGYGCDENPGFAVSPDRRLKFKSPFLGPRDGHFELLHVGLGTPLTATVSHPTLEFVRLTTDFVPDLCPVWGNANTWSIEPYIIAELEPGKSRSWTLRFEFGPRLK